MDIDNLKKDVKKHMELFGTYINESLVYTLINKSKDKELLVIPTGFNFFVKSFAHAATSWHEQKIYLLNIALNKVRDMVKDIKIITVDLTLNIDLHRWITSKPQDIACMISRLCVVKKNSLDKYKFVISDSSYFSIIIQPDYDRIEKENRGISASLLPPIVNIYGENMKTFEKVHYDIENISIKRSESQIIYFFSSNSKFTMKDWVKQHMKNQDIIKYLNDVYKDKGNTNTSNNTFRFLEGSYNIYFSLEDTSIPLKIQATNYRPNILRYLSGMGFAKYDS